MNHIKIKTNDCGVILAPKGSIVLHKFNGHYRVLITGEGEWRAVSEIEYARIDKLLTFEPLVDYV